MTLTLEELSESQLLRSILASLRRLETLAAAPLELPPLQIPGPQPQADLSPLINTIAAMPAAPSPREIALALTEALVPAILGQGQAAPFADAAAALQSALEKLEFRLKGTGAQAYGGGAVSLQPGQAVSLVTPMETGLAKDATLLRRYGTHTTKAGLANATGDNTLHTPALGKSIRLYWIALSASQDNAAENLAIVKFATAGAPIYRWRMGNPGAFAGSRTVEGAVDAPLILNLANTQGVDWNIDLEEI